MPVDTVRCPKSTSKPSPGVDFPRYWLKVVRVHALSHAAKVVELQSSGDFATMMLVAPAVRVNLLPLVLECSVPAWVKSASPLPAACRLINGDILPEANLTRS